MSKPKEPSPAKLIISLITGDKDLIHQTLQRLEGNYGAIDFVSERLEFIHTDYYKKELGDALFRKIVSFMPTIRVDALPSIKMFTNELERNFSTDGGRRRINIDPGYIVLDKLVLASCKNFAHRLYVRDGIYEEITLTYKKGVGFVPFDWTFPDYRKVTMREIMLEIRRRYKHQLSKRHD